ncbi:MAG: alpha/beta fold hydrolase [Cyanobacteria bacterium P01_E01_bin.34]
MNAETFTIPISLPHAPGLHLQARLISPNPGPGSPANGPSVFVLPGSGLSDGDGNDGDIGFAPLAQLAEALGQAGFASLRFDRRGTGATGGDYVSPADELHDFTAVLAHAAQLPEFPKPWVVVGWGEAAAWAGLLTTQRPEAIDGLVLISTPTGAMGDLFPFRQTTDEAMAATPPDEHPALLKRLVDDYASRSPLFMFRPIFEIECPLLVLHGDMDWVCPVFCSRQLVAELERRQQGPSDWIYRELPGLDRWLIRTERWRSLAEQQQPHWRIEMGAVDILVDWLTQKFRV